MKHLLVVVLLLLLVLFAPNAVQAEPPAQGGPPEDSFALIGKAHQNREISLEQATFYRLYALFGDLRLPGRFRSRVPFKEDGTMLMMRTLSVLPQLPEATRRAIVAFYSPAAPSAPQPPPGPTATRTPTPTPIPPPNINYILPLKFLDKIIPAVQFTAITKTAHFAVYYDITGGSLTANPNYASPAYATAVANGLEYAWEHEGGSPDATHLGFNLPAPTHSDGVRYEVYIVHLNGVAGITPPRFNLLSPGSSYLFIDNQQATGFLPELTAHEWNHASQYTYGRDGIVTKTTDYWYMEGTAAWVQFALFGDTPNWKNGVALYFQSPENGFESYDVAKPNLAVYGTALFPKFIQERFGRDIVRASWARIPVAGGVSIAVTLALESTLVDKGTSLAATFADFSRANYLQRYPANEFVWPATIPMVAQRPSIGHPATGKQSNQPDQRIGPLGAHYLLFGDDDLLPQLAARNVTDGVVLTVNLTLNSFKPGRSVGKVYLVRSANPLQVDEGPTLADSASVKFDVNGFGKAYHQIVVVLSNADWFLDPVVGFYISSLQYEYRAEIAPITVNVTADKTGIYNKGDTATFSVLVKDAALQLFDPGKINATLTSPSGTQSAGLAHPGAGTYSYQARLGAAGTYTLAVTATNGGNTGQAQASVNAEKILWMANGNYPSVYMPGVPIHWAETYFQRDNVPPAYVRVYVQPCQGLGGPCQPETYLALQPQNPADTNYTDGAVFSYDMPSDPTGQLVYFYHYQASDGTYTVMSDDPIVQPPNAPAPDPSRPGRRMVGPKR